MNRQENSIAQQQKSSDHPRYNRRQNATSDFGRRAGAAESGGPIHEPADGWHMNPTSRAARAPLVVPGTMRRAP